MIEQLPILQVAVPLLLAPLCLLLRQGGSAWIMAFAGTCFTLLSASLLIEHVALYGPLSYAVGGWEPPWGIGLYVDLLTAYVLLLVSLIALVVLLWARRGLEQEVRKDQISLFYCMYMICLTGALGIVVTEDAFNLFVFLEISSLAAYVLIAMGRDRRALTASFQYLIMGTLGATFILIAIGLLYMMTGTLNLADLAHRLPAVADTTTVRAAFAFLTVGVSLKIALLPLHQWLPNAYTYAPSAVTAFLAGMSTKVSLYILLRSFYSVFGTEFVFETLRLHVILLPLSVAAILGASVIAVFQQDIKRMLAYSSVAQIGYMTLGLSLLSNTGLTATLVHLFNHGVIKGGLFLAVGCLSLRTGSTRLADLRGIGRQMPWTMGAIVVGGCALIGIPLTSGFVSKWYLVIAALEQDAWLVVAFIVVGSLIAVVYVFRILETLYFGEASVSVREAPAAVLIPTWFLILLSVWFGINTELTVGVSSEIAVLLRGGP